MPQIRTATITAGLNYSDTISVIGKNIDYEIGSIIMKSGQSYSNTTYTFQAQIDGVWYDIFDTFGIQYTVASTEGKHSLPADVFKDVNYVRVKGASNEASDSEFIFLLIDILK